MKLDINIKKGIKIMPDMDLNKKAANGGALDGHRHRVVVSTDIGGTDADDYQSMVHLLLYSDCLDIEGLISSSGIGGKGRTSDIFTVIDCYEKDYNNLKRFSDNYPEPDSLRAITKQGEINFPPYQGFQKPTEGSELIVKCAQKDDPRPLYVLGWGGIEDIAQALHDAPDIVSKLRFHWVGGPNKKWGPNQYQYVVENHPELFIIEDNASYRGWFTGGDQRGQWENGEFVKQHIAGKGALADFFCLQYDGAIKMGDTPTVGWVLKGMPEDPTKPGWGGNFVRAWDRPYKYLDRMPTENETMEIFGVLELALPLGETTGTQVEAHLVVENQSISGHMPGDGTIRFRFCAKAAKVFQFNVESNSPALNGQTGTVTAIAPESGIELNPCKHLPNWWTDTPDPEYAEGEHHGAKTVSQWRRDFLGDFAERMARCSK